MKKVWPLTLSFLKKSTSAQLDFWKEKKFNKMIIKSSVRINVGEEPRKHLKRNIKDLALQAINMCFKSISSNVDRLSKKQSMYTIRVTE